MTVLITRAKCKTVRNMRLALARELHVAGIALIAVTMWALFSVKEHQEAPLSNSNSLWG